MAAPVWDLIVELSRIDASVISLEYLLNIQSLLRQTVSAVLAHADAVPPAAPDEDKAGDVIVRPIDAIDYEQLFAQPQRRANTPTTNVADALGADDFQINHAARRAPRSDFQICEPPDSSHRTCEPGLHLSHGQFAGPIRERRKAF